MYNKLFTKILDSSVWLEPTPTRIVWVTLLAAMDQDGYAHFSAIGNLAARARVTVEEAQHAVECFISPDPESGDQEFEGRRVERVPGGFMILNAPKYRDLVTAAVIREQTRLRVEKHRHKDNVTQCNGPPLKVTPSVAQANTSTEKPEPKKERARKRAVLVPLPEPFEISDRVRAWAAGYDFGRLDEHLEHFVTTAKARAYVYADWDAALMNAIRKDWAGIRATGQSQTINPAMGKTAQAMQTLQGMKNGHKRSDPEPHATLALSGAGRPAGG